MPSFVLPVTHVSGTPVTYVPSLYTLPPGEAKVFARQTLMRFFIGQYLKEFYGSREMGYLQTSGRTKKSPGGL